MGEEDQVRPFALASPRISMDEENASAEAKKRLRRRRCIRCCGCSLVTLLIVIIVFIILIFTVFKVKDPTITMNSVQFDNVSISNPSTPSSPNLTNPSSPTTEDPSINVTMTSDMSIYNPNIASFKFNSTSTSLYYYGSEVGTAINPAGNAGARKTLHMNMTVLLFIDPSTTSTQEVQNLTRDISSGSMTMNSYTNMNGRVNVLNIFKKNINVKMNCTMDVAISTTTMTLENMNCKSKVTM